MANVLHCRTLCILHCSHYSKGGIILYYEMFMPFLLVVLRVTCMISSLNHPHWSVVFNHQLTPHSTSQTALFGMLHLICETNVLLLFMFLISLVHHHHPALFHWVTGLSPSWVSLHNGLGQATYTCVPLSPSSIIWYWPSRVISLAGKVTVGLVESNGSLPLGLWLSHLQAERPGSALSPMLFNQVWEYLYLSFGMSMSRLYTKVIGWRSRSQQVSVSCSWVV